MRATRRRAPRATGTLAPMTPTRDFPDLPGQRGLATVAQLLEHGWTRSAVDQARARTFQEPMPRVLARHRGPLDAATRTCAWALWAGPSAVFTGSSALSLWGLTIRGGLPVTLVVPASGRARQHGRVRLVRSTREIIGRRSGILRIAGGARALADAAVYEKHRPDDLEHWTITVLQRGLSTPEAVERELWLRPRARVASVWRGLAGYVDGAWSRPEVVLREVVDGDGGFPPLVTNCRLLAPAGDLIGVPDGYLEAAGVAIQVHSRQYHQGLDDQGGDRWSETVERDGAFAAAGVRVIGVTPWTLYAKPQRFVSRLRQVVEVGLQGPRPAVRVVPHAP